MYSIVWPRSEKKLNKFGLHQITVHMRYHRGILFKLFSSFLQFEYQKTVIHGDDHIYRVCDRVDCGIKLEINAYCIYKMIISLHVLK